MTRKNGNATETDQKKIECGNIWTLTKRKEFSLNNTFQLLLSLVVQISSDADTSK